jgi:hypothetical protein
MEDSEMNTEQRYTIDWLRQDLIDLKQYFSTSNRVRWDKGYLMRRCGLALQGLKIVREIEPTYYRSFPLKQRELTSLMRRELAQ